MIIISKEIERVLGTVILLLQPQPWSFTEVTAPLSLQSRVFGISVMALKSKLFTLIELGKVEILFLL